MRGSCSVRWARILSELNLQFWKDVSSVYEIQRIQVYIEKCTHSVISVCFVIRWPRRISVPAPEWVKSSLWRCSAEIMETDEDRGRCIRRSWISLIFNFVPYFTQDSFKRSWYSYQLCRSQYCAQSRRSCIYDSYFIQIDHVKFFPSIGIEDATLFIQIDNL